MISLIFNILHFPRPFSVCVTYNQYPIRQFGNPNFNSFLFDYFGWLFLDYISHHFDIQWEGVGTKSRVLSSDLSLGHPMTRWHVSGRRCGRSQSPVRGGQGPGVQQLTDCDKESRGGDTGSREHLLTRSESGGWVGMSPHVCHSSDAIFHTPWPRIQHSTQSTASYLFLNRPLCDGLWIGSIIIGCIAPAWHHDILPGSADRSHPAISPGCPPLQYSVSGGVSTNTPSTWWD